MRRSPRRLNGTTTTEEVKEETGEEAAAVTETAVATVETVTVVTVAGRAVMEGKEARDNSFLPTSSALPGHA